MVATEDSATARGSRRKSVPADADGQSANPPTRGYTQSKEQYLRRLRRIEGQIRGIHRMIDEDVYCIDVLTQVSAVTAALRALSLGLVEDHLGHCVLTAARSEDEAEAAEKLREAADAIARLVKN